MSKTHYDALGLPPTATPAEIRSAYRKLVLVHHPDKSKAPRSLEIFRRASDAYEILGNAEKRLVYDDTLRRLAALKEEQERKQREKEKHEREARAATFATPTTARITPDVQRLTSLFARGNLAEAETLAREITKNDPRQPLPYAVMGDIARSRGNINEAQKMYAYAAQFDPTNPVYQRRYEQLLSASVVVTGKGSSMRLASHGENWVAVAVGGGVLLGVSSFVAFSGEKPVFQALSLVSSWTMGLLFMLLLAGIALGSALAVGNFLDRFTEVSVNAVGRVGPAVILGAVALVNFWAAVLLYVFLGVAQKAFNYSTTRLVVGVFAVVLLMTLAASISASVKPSQVFLWGGNVAYFGALIGWMVSDAFRSS